MNNFWQRLITGVFFISILSLAIMNGVMASAALFFLASLIGASEYLIILEKGKKASPSKFFTFLSVAVVHFLFFLVSTGMADLTILAAAVPVLFFQAIVELFRDKPDGFTRIAMAFFGTIWIGLPFALLPFLGTLSGTYSGWIPLGFFLLLWTNDTGAYVTGRLVGKHKLAPKISPGKTIEGFVGGVLFALILAYFLPSITHQLSLMQWVVIALIIAIFSNAGDLVESMLKRSCGVKDSGNVLPGHGGILDRFDGILLAVPVILAYLLLSI